nr:ribonuclease H-like domain-containing protein [Tanacetum cinerariifolium]
MKVRPNGSSGPSTRSKKGRMQCSGDDIDLNPNSNFTFINDRQKGIIPSIKTVFPSAEHIYCLRPIRFEKCMLELKKMNHKLHELLIKIPPEHLARSYFSGRAKSDLLLNNIYEVFNGKIVRGRDKPKFGSNKETKKVQKTLLKQQYENFSGSSSKSLDQIHDRLQKLISQLEILGESISQEDIKADLEDQSLDDLFNNLKIYEAEVKSSSSTSVSAASTKALVSTLPNVDNLCDVVIYSFFASQSNSPQLENEDLKQIDANDLEEMYLKWSPRDTRNKDTQRRTIPLETSTSNALVSQCDGVGSYHWSFQVDEKPTNYALMAFTSSSSSNSSGSENEAAPCSKACSKAYATLQSHYDKLTVDFRKSQFDVLSYKSGLEFIEARLVVYQQNKNVFEEDIKQLKLDVISESDDSVPISPVNDMYKLGEGYHAVSPPYTGTFMPPKPDLVFYDAPTASETVPNVFNVEPSTTKPNKDMSQSNRPSAPIIEDWVSDSEDESELVLTRSRLVPLNGARPVTTDVPQTTVKNQRSAKHVVIKPHSPIRRPINHGPAPKNSNFYQKVTIVKTKKVNVIQGTKGNWQALKDKGIIDSGCSRHMTGNISYLSDFEEINRGYVAFGGNPKGGKITGKGKIKTGKLDFDDVYFVKALKFNLFSVSQMCDKKTNVLFTDTECVVLSLDFKLPDKNHVLLWVPKENNMYNIDLKNVVPSGDLTCLFAKATLDESNLWHRRLGHINFKTMNKLVKGTDLVTPAGTDLVTPAGTDLVTPAGTDLVTPAGTALVYPAGTNLDSFSDNRSRHFSDNRSSSATVLTGLVHRQLESI